MDSDDLIYEDAVIKCAEGHDMYLAIKKDSLTRYTYCPQCRKPMLFTRKDKTEFMEGLNG